jgi:hypothetical protein
MGVSSSFVGLRDEPDYLVVGSVFFNAPQLAAEKFTI